LTLIWRAARWLFIGLYIIFVVTQHETVQGILGPIADRLGRPLFYNLMGAGALLWGAALSGTFWFWSRASAARNPLRIAMASALLLTIASFFVLTVNNAEIVHYPQYAILAVLLFRSCLSVGDTVAWCTLVGLLDEGYQYFVLHPTWGVPWDFNDVTLDICGAWLGALWIASSYKAVQQPNPLWWRRAGIIGISSFVATIPVLVSLNKVQLYENKNYVGWWFAMSRLRIDSFWFYDASWGSRTIHLLTPVEGLILLSILVLAAASIDRKFAFLR
jgi:hypothetical protein